MTKEDWVAADVITMTAPALRIRSEAYANAYGQGMSMSPDELYACHVRRARHMLTCAAAENTNILVLGAFGCGAFHNDPKIVAKAYKDVLQDFPKVFEKIVFAVYCSPRNHSNFDAFQDMFGRKGI